jgi:hypothetical protein
MDLRRDRLDGRLRAVETVKRADAAITTAAETTMAEGRPGVPR